MENDFSFIELSNLNDDDVILFSETQMTRFSNFKEACNDGMNNGFLSGLRYHTSTYNIEVKAKDFLDSGVDCEFLKIGANGWKKGKMKLTMKLEFIPDEPRIQEPESCLDDIRREIYKQQES